MQKPLERLLRARKSSFSDYLLNNSHVPGTMLRAGDPVMKKATIRASLVAQWLRVCLLMQGTRVRALVWEDPTCRGATRPVSHNY